MACQCAQYLQGVQYVVAQRKPSAGLDARSSTAIKSAVAQKKIARAPAATGP